VTDRTAVLLILLSLPGFGMAQPHASPEAQRHFEAGRTAFDTGDYEASVREFQTAYDMTQHPDVLFNIYSAAERAGQLQRAQDALQRYLNEGQVGERRSALEDRLANLRERIAEEQRNAAQQQTDEERRLAEERRATEERVRNALTEPPATGPSWVSIGTLIGAGVLLANFGVFAALSTVEAGSLGSGCGLARACTSAQTSALSAYNIVADISWISGAALATLGVIFIFALPPERAARTAPAAWIMPTLGGVAMGGRW
jgi:hypothetical protein